MLFLSGISILFDSSLCFDRNTRSPPKIPDSFEWIKVSWVIECPDCSASEISGLIEITRHFPQTS